MFLTAVLNAHTDKAGQTLPAANQQTKAPASPDTDSDHLPAALKAALARPVEDRVLQLPSIHRSRWV